MNSRVAKIEDLSGIKATVMGLGLNGGGLSSARFLAQHGAIVTVTDMKDEKALADSIQALEGLPIRYVLGRHEIADFSEADLVVKNPAVRPDSPYLKASMESRALLETDISLFLRFSAAPIIAVTGSKGKSSTSSAIHHVLTQPGRSAFLGGNIAISPLSFIDKTSESSPVVLELSSWQLADMRGLGVLKPKVALITSIMPDHMNRYTSMEEYVADKRLIYADQDAGDFTICNADDAWGKSFASETKGSVLWFGEGRSKLPGAWIEAGKQGIGCCDLRGDGRDIQTILPAELLVPGAHQRKNMLAAALACRAFGVDSSSIQEAMASFAGVEHRLESFARKDGITWYNDSAATIPQAVAAALEAFEEPIVLITGGTDKNLDFTPVRKAYAKAKSILLLAGSGTDKLRPLLDEDGIDYEGPFDSLKPALDRALALARKGDIVLLSPGCTSFGMFTNEFDRGRKFKEAAKALLGL